MTISSTTNRVAYTGNGVTTAFSFPYYFLADGDLVVIETTIATGEEETLVLNSDYTVTGAGEQAGGTVTAAVAPASTVTWTILRDPAITQSVDAVENDPLPVEEALEKPLDRLTMIAQRLAERILRALRQPDGDAATIGALPPKVERAGFFLAFDDDGNPIAAAGTTGDMDPVSAFMATLLNDADAATARATLGVTLVDDADLIAIAAFSSAAANFGQIMQVTSAGGWQLAGPRADFKNGFINGEFELMQRHGNVTRSCTAGNRNYPFDRFAVIPVGNTMTAQRSTTVPTGSKARFSCQLNGAASVTTVDLSYRMEAAHVRAYKGSVTISYAVFNGSGASFTPSLRIASANASDVFSAAGITNRLDQALQSCADNAWTVVSHTLDLSALTDVDNGLQIDLRIPSGSLVASDVVRIAEAQLEPGPARTPFHPVPLEVLVSRARRYLWKTYDLDVAIQTATTAGIMVWSLPTNATGWVGSVTLPVEMRAIPTVTFADAAAVAGQWLRGASATNMDGVTGAPHSPRRINFNNTNAPGAAGSVLGHVWADAEFTTL